MLVRLHLVVAVDDDDNDDKWDDSGDSYGQV